MRILTKHMNINQNKPYDGIPQTKEEMERIRGEIGQLDTQKILEKAQKKNARIEMAQKMKRMFESEEFQAFWHIVNTGIKEVTNQSVTSIKGSPLGGQGYDPLGQLVQLNYIQGGLNVLETQELEKKSIEDDAKLELIDTLELEQKIKQVNQINNI